MVEVLVNLSGNSIAVGGQVARGRRRWEALTLACLVDAGGLGLSAAALQLTLQRAGQATPLDRTGLLRLFKCIESMLDDMLGAGAFAQRVRFAPRRRTVGPWRFAPQADEDWRVLGDSQDTVPLPRSRATAGRPAVDWGDRNGTPQRQPRLVADFEPCATFRALELLLRSDALSASGHVREASDLLLAAAAVPKLTVEGQGLIDLRRARLLERSGRHDEALELASDAARRAGQRGFADPGQKCLAMQLARRIRYDRAPQDCESLGADPYFVTLSAQLDPRGLGEAENLAALLARRRATRLGTRDGIDEARRLLHEAWQHSNAAVYWATSARRYEDAENFVFNMGRIQASLHDLGGCGAVAASLRSYQIGLLIRDNFFVGNDSVWAQICIGNLWLQHPERRPEIEAALGMERSKPCDSAFYLDACAQAKLIGDPRQVALCYVNLWSFGADAGSDAGPSATIQRMAREQLLDLLRGRLDLRETLLLDAPEAMAKILGPLTAPAGLSFRCAPGLITGR